MGVDVADTPQRGDSPDISGRRAALQQFPWRVAQRLSSGLGGLEHFLVRAGFDRAPWFAVAFALGIAAWFVADNRWQWLGFMAVALAIALGALALMREDGRYPFMRQALAAVALAAAAGCGTVWTKSALVGTPAIARPTVGDVYGRVIARQEQPAYDRVRLTIAMREAVTGRPIKVRINVPLEKDTALAHEGALVRVKARLVPPAPPMLPGSYDFARAAWFAGLSATGTALSPVEVIAVGSGDGKRLAQLQRRISDHAHAQIPGSAGGIAAAFSSGDRGGIAKADEDAMRAAGVTHLLSVSGLHVSAVIITTYFFAIRLLALWPWLALRYRLPLIAAGTSALTGIGYTLLTGAEVPTVRSCIGALLVLGALAMGREALSMRMLAVAAFLVMLLWPEAVVGPSFQLSFGSVMAIIALHGSDPMRRFLAPREEPWWVRGLRLITMLLITGVVIELALMPMLLFHFHRSGVYGALVNVMAIPLTTFISMPLIALAFLFDAVGAGAPFWWLAGQSLNFLLAMARWVAAQPGAVTHLPAMGQAGFALFLGGSLWLALWRGRVRLWGLLPVALGSVNLALISPPDLLISGDGRHVGITGLAGDELVVLRETRSNYLRENLTEIAGMDGATRLIDDWPGARCTPEFCTLDVIGGGRTWRLLMARGQERVPLGDLVAACERSDIVIAARRLPFVCRPALLKADRAMLDRTGGMTIDFGTGQIRTVADLAGQHGWWQPVVRPPWKAKPGIITTSAPAITNK